LQPKSKTKYSICVEDGGYISTSDVEEEGDDDDVAGMSVGLWY
jgi:hypothetical protein